ncbi:hypothetical protein K435DRAFT_880966 [Dendrothele bispora CBS 962.96]|uniref:Uncharacterized protein n=1 Tax=Dendrothele bispora (strain CBS 962.96) TaxID=1314807 RepID=A0A4V4HAG3_DENBC|nr:hypothetical protein K435DRAFT_880966 [Dendrothele bispora CBS 962.96]
MPRGAGRGRGRPSNKRSYHERLEDNDDLEIVHSRTARINAHGLTVSTPKSPQKGRATWDSGSSTWGPEDDTEFALEDDGSWIDEIDRDVFDSESRTAPGTEVIQVQLPRRRTKVSRRVNLVWKDLHRQRYLDYEAL